MHGVLYPSQLLMTLFHPSSLKTSDAPSVDRPASTVNMNQKIRIQSGQKILEEQNYTDFSVRVQTLVGDAAIYQRYYLPLMRTYAEYVQKLPVTEGGHYSHSGGMLDYGLDLAYSSVIHYSQYILVHGDTAMHRLRQNFLYATFSAALTRIIASLHFQYQVIGYDTQNDQTGNIWNPFKGSMRSLYYMYYNFKWVESLTRDTAFDQISLLLSKQCLDDHNSFSFIASDKEVLRQWLSVFDSYVSPDAMTLMLEFILIGQAKIFFQYFQNSDRLSNIRIKQDLYLPFNAADAPSAATFVHGATLGSESLALLEHSKNQVALAGYGFAAWLRHKIMKSSQDEMPYLFSIDAQNQLMITPACLQAYAIECGKAHTNLTPARLAYLLRHIGFRNVAFDSKTGQISIDWKEATILTARFNALQDRLGLEGLLRSTREPIMHALIEKTPPPISKPFYEK